MKVDVEHEWTLFLERLPKLLCGEDGWVQHFRGYFPLTVEVTARERAAVVAVDDTVGVEHW